MRRRLTRADAAARPARKPSIIAPLPMPDDSHRVALDLGGCPFTAGLPRR